MEIYSQPSIKLLCITDLLILLENIALPLEIDRCIEVTDNLCNLFDSDTSFGNLETPTMGTLRYLWDQANLLYDSVQRKPEKEGRSGRDYFDGVKLGELAYKIALKLEARNLTNLAEIALRIRLKAILQVQGHYHHIVGPAMLEHCAVLGNLGRTEEAMENYDCIISDFSWLLDDYDEDEKIEYEEDVVSIQSLQKALTLRLTWDIPLQEKKTLEDKLKKAGLLLSN